METIWPHVDQIVIVDQSSTDDTAWEVAMFVSHHAKGKNPVDVKLIKDKHWGFCEPSRVKAHGHCDGDWILVLDADERITGEFISEMRTIDEAGYVGCSLIRPLYVGGVHQHDGDHIYRYFNKGAVSYLPAIHTAPMPNVLDQDIYWPSYAGILHEKSFVEQLRDEIAYEKILLRSDSNPTTKLGLNSFLNRLHEMGLTTNQVEKMSEEELRRVLVR